MSEEGNGLATIAIIEEMIHDYQVSLSIHTEDRDDVIFYVVMVIWRDTLSEHVSGSGYSLYTAVTEAYDNLIEFISQ